MATLVGLTIVKKFTYRGDASEEFSNHYYLTGSVPADAAAWLTLAGQVIFYEKAVYPSSVHVVRAYGYNDDAEDAHAVWSYDYTANSAEVAGTLTTTGGVVCPGDDAVWVRWKTSRTNSKGRPIYLRKYFHPAVAVSGSPDSVLTAQRTNLEALGAALAPSGGLGRTVRSRTHAETLTGYTSSAYVTTRTLKRRGKRPGS